MYTDGRRAWDVRIALIGGAADGRALPLMGDLSLEESVAGTVALWDTDATGCARAAALGARMRREPGAAGRFAFTACRSQAEALDGADFVCAFGRAPSPRELESDLHAPELCGVYQGAGDAAGPGGLMRALRMGPALERLALDVKARCPRAFVLLLCDPVAHGLRAMYAAYPQIRALGLTADVPDALALLCRALYEMRGVAGARAREVVYAAAGVSRFCCITRAAWHDVDLMGVWQDFARKFAVSGYAEGQEDAWLSDPSACARRVQLDLSLRLGTLPAGEDRRLADFLPSTRYLRTPECALEWKFGRTGAAFHRERRRAFDAHAARLLSGEESASPAPSGGPAATALRALCGLGDALVSASLPNAGQIENAPRQAAVETPVLLRAGSAVPLMAGPLAPPLSALLAPAFAAQEGVLAALRARDAQQAVSAFLGDPMLCRVPERAALKLMRTMLQDCAESLRGWNLEVR